MKNESRILHVKDLIRSLSEEVADGERNKTVKPDLLSALQAAAILLGILERLD